MEFIGPVWIAKNVFNKDIDYLLKNYIYYEKIGT